MIRCEGDLVINRNPKDIPHLIPYISTKEIDGKNKLVFNIDDVFESKADFLRWYENTVKKPILLNGKTYLNGKIVVTDMDDMNQSGDYLVKFTFLSFQPVLPMF